MNMVDCLGCKYYKEINGFPNKNCNMCKGLGQVQDPKEILCNLCGEYLCPNVENANSQIPHGLYNAKVAGGYDSDYLIDLHVYEFNLCEKCLRTIFEKSVIKPKVKDYFNENVVISFEEDQEIYEYSYWERSGGSHNAYLNGKCNSAKDCPNKAIYSVFLSDEFTEHSACEKHKNRWDNTVNAILHKFIKKEMRPLL